MQSKNTKLLLKNPEETICEMIDIAPYKIGYFIARCPDSKKNNEDSLFIAQKDQEILFGVSDGAGGHPKGDEASALACQSSYDYFIKENTLNPMELFDQVNQNVLSLKVGAHCTLIMGHIKNNFFNCHSVGDSEAIYWNSQGKIIYSNIPHSETGYKIQSGVLDQEESLDDPDRNIVTNLIGDPAIRIESTSKIEVKKGHIILIGSDGLFDNISHASLSEIIAKGPFEESFQELCRLCREQNPQDWKKSDDISFVVVKNYYR